MFNMSTLFFQDFGCHIWSLKLDKNFSIEIFFLNGIVQII
jgi:hypothetical protein